MELELKHRVAWPNLDKLAEALVVGLVILLVLVLFSPANTPVIPRDEGVFIYIGQGILAGKLPYRDLWDHKGPLIYYIDALGLWIGQGSLWGIWLVEAFLLALSLLLLYRTLREVISRDAAFFGLLVWVAGFSIVMGGNIVEEYSIPVTVLALIVALKRARWAGLWLGLLAGLGFLLRPNEIAGPLVGLCFVLQDSLRSRDGKTFAGNALRFSAGFVLITGAAAAFFASNGALGDLLSSVFLFNLSYISHSGSILASLLAGAGYLVIPLIFAVAGLLPAMVSMPTALTSNQRRLLQMAALLLLAAVSLSLLSGRSYRHYYVPWLLPLSVLSSFCPLWLRRAWPHGWRPKAVWALCWSVSILAVIVGIRIRIVPLLAGGASSPEMQAVEALRALQPRESELFVWGDETSYAVMAQRKLAGRYIYAWPLLSPRYGTTIAPQVLADISARRPLLIDTSGSAGGPSPLAAEPPYPYLAPLYSFIHEHYEVVGRVPGKNWVVWGPK